MGHRKQRKRHIKRKGSKTKVYIALAFFASLTFIGFLGIDPGTFTPAIVASQYVEGVTPDFNVLAASVTGERLTVNIANFGRLMAFEAIGTGTDGKYYNFGTFEISGDSEKTIILDVPEGVVLAEVTVRELSTGISDFAYLT